LPVRDSAAIAVPRSRMTPSRLRPRTETSSICGRDSHCARAARSVIGGRRRAQDRHRTIRRHQGLDRVDATRSRRGASDRRPGAAAYDGGGASLRRLTGGKFRTRSLSYLASGRRRPRVPPPPVLPTYKRHHHAACHWRHEGAACPPGLPRVERPAARAAFVPSQTRHCRAASTTRGAVGYFDLLRHAGRTERRQGVDSREAFFQLSQALLRPLGRYASVAQFNAKRGHFSLVGAHPFRRKISGACPVRARGPKPQRNDHGHQNPPVMTRSLEVHATLIRLCADERQTASLAIDPI